ncbi:beta-parvin [Plodia interpunctella]|uniref:beta-parvin n=1 Tax=Plodia interpunctella TaxID=58824 RepID=UPI002368161D|nr:beta-parvin [Plodia interpunctella]XP_053623617.1 beta-parvin [Plodia interpunctella]XP_053623618.1 beta-parvin [Plodia interpunctella]
MSSPRPKSPRTPVLSKKDEKEESIWDKLGTIGRKKRIKEVQEVQAEGKHAIDSPGSPTAPEVPPEEYSLLENEERAIIDPKSHEDPKVKELKQVLIDWINDELAMQRIIVKDIEEDLYDGQVLQKLLEKLTKTKLDVPEVTQSEEGQRQKLAVVLRAVNKVLFGSTKPAQKWNVDSIHSKSVVSILHLLVALARHFRAPIRLPENVKVAVVVVKKENSQGMQLSHRSYMEDITTTYDDLGMKCERDAFDALFDHAPDKLQVVKKSLITFVNKHLSKVYLEVTDLDTQFHDGVYLCLLMGLLEGFFVPLYDFHLTPQNFDQKVHNVSFAFELMQDVGLAKPKARPEDIVNLDLKSTLRVLYNLFTKYKNMP